MVMTLLVPDKEDPSSVLSRGGLEVTWRGGVKTKKFRQMPFPHARKEDLTLPMLYLHFLDDMFKVKPNEFDPGLRAGNDNSEQQLVVPETFTSPELPPHNGGEDLDKCLKIVLGFLRDEATVPVSAVVTKAGGFSPQKNYTVVAEPRRWYFSLKTSRPKTEISLDKKLFGIPEDSQIYLFAESHVSVTFMTKAQCQAFEDCIDLLLEVIEEGNKSTGVQSIWQKFATFLKVFYEGGFAYNNRISGGAGSYLPKMTGLAALGITPSFEGQGGIATGYPYLVPPACLSFADSVPVTIKAISEMSDRHLRYGLCFTRCVFVWEDENFDREKTLCFCSILPHGGFFYMPRTLEEFNNFGGLVYAFGEDKESRDRVLCSDEGGNQDRAAEAAARQEK